MKITYIMGTALTKWRLFFPQTLLSYQQTFPPLCETLCAGCVKVFAEALELFTRAVFQVVIVDKTAISGCILQGSQKVVVCWC